MGQWRIESKQLPIDGSNIIVDFEAEGKEVTTERRTIARAFLVVEDTPQLGLNPGTISLNQGGGPEPSGWKSLRAREKGRLQ